MPVQRESNVPAEGGPVRRMYVPKKLVDKFKATPGCPGCRSVEAGGKAVTHTDTCRERMKRKLAEAEDEEAKQRLKREEERMDEHFQEEVRKQARTNPTVAEEQRKHEEAMEETEKKDEPSTATAPTGSGSSSASMPPPASTTSRGRKRDAERTVEDLDPANPARAESPESTATCATDIPSGDIELGVFLGNWEVLVSEVYSPPRVAPVAAKKLGFKVGTSMDLTTKDEHGRAWDFTKVEMRNFAYRKVCEEKPFILIGSPVCTPWSQVMNINYSRMTWEEKERILNAARVHLEFVCKLYRLQHQAGRYFAHEHPQGAASWKEASVREIRRWTGIECLTIDQCMYGLLSKTDLGEQLPARKATTIMTNCPALSVTLNKRCHHSHTHQQLI